MIKFRGSLEELQDIVIRCAILGKWSFHKKSRFYRFQAATGAILNWWPNTGTINFQGQDAQEFERLFLEHALVGPAQSEPGPVCEESAWQAVPGPTPPPADGSREFPSFAGTGNRRKRAPQPLPRLIPRSSSFSPPPTATETELEDHGAWRRYCSWPPPKVSERSSSSYRIPPARRATERPVRMTKTRNMPAHRSLPLREATPLLQRAVLNQLTMREIEKGWRLKKRGKAAFAPYPS
jgi:hypothetical protein